MPNFDMHIEHKNPRGISQNGMLPPMRVLFSKVTVFFPQYLMSAHQIPVAYYIV
jgi:hypothetical protein